MRRQDKRKLPDELKKQAERLGEAEFLEYAESRKLDVSRLTERQARILLNDLRRGIKFKNARFERKKNATNKIQKKKKMNEGVEMNTSDNIPDNKDRARNIFRFNFKSFIIGVILGIIVGCFITYFYGGRYEVVDQSKKTIKYDRWTGESWILRLHQFNDKYYWEQVKENYK